MILPDNDENGNSEQEDSDRESNLDPTEHMKSLKNLKDTDPEFYQYLKENDKNLLDFKMSEDEEEEEEDDDDNSSINNDRFIPESVEACIFRNTSLTLHVLYSSFLIICVYFCFIAAQRRQ